MGTCGVTKNVPFLEVSDYMSYMHVNQAFQTPQTRFPRLKRRKVKGVSTGLKLFDTRLFAF